MDLVSELARLAEPISPDKPCGESLEDTPTLAAFDAYRVFGQLTAPTNEPDWRELQELSLQALHQSKDFRLLAHLTATALRTQDLIDVLRIFPLIETWLTRYWDEVHPRIDDDAIMRKNALGGFADRVAIVDALRRLPIVSHPQLGSVSLRDIDIAAGTIPNPDPETEPRSEAELTAAVEQSDAAPLIELSQLAAAAQRALSAAEDIMYTRGGKAGSSPQLDLLSTQLARIQQVLSARIATVSEPGIGMPPSGDGEQADTPAAALAVGAVKSRQDAIRALDAVATYFRKNEPSSPVPLLVERAKRMVSMDFLEALAELAPDGLDQARKAAGFREPQ
jgi:type VI secretion system protein ImpA